MSIVLFMLSLAMFPASGHASADARPTVRIALCQTLCIDGDREGNLRRIEYAVEDAREEGAKIACFPETALLGWINPKAHDLADPIPGPTTDRLGEIAARHDMMLCVGLCERDGEALHDSVVLIGADGEIIGVHRKVNILAELMDPPYTPGPAEATRVFDTPFGRVGMLVCADTFRDDLVESVRAQGADLLLVPYGWAAAPDAWPKHGESLKGWVQATARRADCPVVGTDLVGSVTNGPWTGMTYGGQSLLAYPDGTVPGVLRDRASDLRVFDVPCGTPSSP